MYSLYPRFSSLRASIPRIATSARTKPKMACDESSPSSLSAASLITSQLILLRRRFIIFPRTDPGANSSAKLACRTLRTPLWPFATTRIAAARRAPPRPASEGRARGEAPGARNAPAPSIARAGWDVRDATRGAGLSRPPKPCMGFVEGLEPDGDSDGRHRSDRSSSQCPRRATASHARDDATPPTPRPRPPPSPRTRWRRSSRARARSWTASNPSR